MLQNCDLNVWSEFKCDCNHKNISMKTAFKPKLISCSRAIIKVKWKSKYRRHKCLQRGKRWLMKTLFQMSVTSKYSKQEQTYNLNFQASFTRGIGYVHELGLLCLGSWYQSHSSRKFSCSIFYVELSTSTWTLKLFMLHVFLISKKCSAFSLDVS